MAQVAPVLAQQVKVSFACANLKSKDLLSPSDPFIRVYERNVDQRWIEIGKTETVVNNNNPQFSKNFTIDYFFEKNQQYKLEIYDEDDVTSHDKIGSCEFSLGNVVSAPGGVVSIPITKTNNKTSKKMKTIVRADVVPVSKLFAHIDVRLKDVKKSSWLATFDADDLFYQLIKTRPDGSEMIVYTSEVIMDTQKPDFKPCKVSLNDLCDNDMNKSFCFRLLRLKSTGAHEFMSENRQVCPANVLVAPGEPEKKIDIFNKKGKDCGDVFIERFHIVEEPTFLDYVVGGLDFNVTFALDFTASNGAPNTPSSLHYIDPTGAKPNQYIQALRTIGNIVCSYAAKQDIVALGFGGFVSLDGQPPVTSHCFPLSCQTQYPFFPGVEAVVQGYVNALTHIQLSGPTYMSDLVNSAMFGAKRPYSPTYQHFSVLCILTDGIINDMQKTINSIVEASHTPLCIIIIGVGNANFSDMSKLDADDAMLRNDRGQYAAADIVQFVQFNKFHSVEALAAETLREIPSTVLSFMHRNGIKPLPPRNATVTTTTTTTTTAPSPAQQPAAAPPAY